VIKYIYRCVIHGFALHDSLVTTLYCDV